MPEGNVVVTHLRKYGLMAATSAAKWSCGIWRYRGDVSMTAATRGGVAVTILAASLPCSSSPAQLPHVLIAGFCWTACWTDYQFEDFHRPSLHSSPAHGLNWRWLPSQPKTREVVIKSWDVSTEVRDCEPFSSLTVWAWSSIETLVQSQYTVLTKENDDNKLLKRIIP